MKNWEKFAVLGGILIAVTTFLFNAHYDWHLFEALPQCKVVAREDIGVIPAYTVSTLTYTCPDLYDKCILRKCSATQADYCRDQGDFLVEIENGRTFSWSTNEPKNVNYYLNTVNYACLMTCPDGSIHYKGECPVAPPPGQTCEQNNLYTQKQSGMDCTATTVGNLNCFNCVKSQNIFMKIWNWLKSLFVW